MKTILLKIGLLLFSYLYLLPICGYSSTYISVSNQKEFNNLSEIIQSVIDKGDNNICVHIAKGIYYFWENHINLKDINNKNLSIKISGEDAIIIPRGRYYKNGDHYQGAFSRDCSWMHDSNDITTWSRSMWSDGIVEVVSKDSKLCRIHSKEVLPKLEDVTNAYILITEWFRSGVYKIDKIEDQYVYFLVTKPEQSTLNKGIRQNDDYYFAHIYPRFKLCNVIGEDNNLLIKGTHVILPHGVDKVYEGQTTRFLALSNCKIDAFELNGISFYGSRFKYLSSFLSLENIDANNIRISNCSFRGLRSNVLSVKDVNNVTIDNCLFRDCYRYVISVDNNSAKTTIQYNRFENIGASMLNTFSVICKGKDYLISNNYFKDFGYGGIGVGVWHGDEKKNPCIGVVERNILSYSEEYRNQKANYSLMDGGAIYLWTKHDETVIRYNSIDGYTGMASNQGVFCDDGAYNYQIYGNTILNIDSGCYSIASRRVPSVEKSRRPGSTIEHSNINNVIRDNIIDGRILFEGNEINNNGCVLGKNYVVLRSGDEIPENIIKNVSKQAKTIPISCNRIEDGIVLLPMNEYNKLKSNTSEWNELKNSVRKQ